MTPGKLATRLETLFINVNQKFKKVGVSFILLV